MHWLDEIYTALAASRLWLGQLEPATLGDEHRRLELTKARLERCLRTIKALMLAELRQRPQLN